MVKLDTRMTRAWAEIDLAAIRANFGAAKAHAARYGADTLAIVKADAYGHGAARVASELENRCGAAMFAVATFSEALELTEAGITAPILLLSEVHSSLYGELVRHEGVIPSIFRLESAAALSDAAAAAGKRMNCFLIADTGMSRIGIECTTPEKMAAGLQTAEQIAALPGIRVYGVFSHYACADEEDKSSAHRQTALFDEFLAGLDARGIHPEIRSMCNSAALIEAEFANKYDLVREGIGIYGLNPSDCVAKILPLRPAMSLKARVTDVKTLDKGVGISYGHTFVTERETRVATIPVGYADGYPRLLSGKAGVLIDDRFAPILGRVCMDQMMVDVSDIPSARVDSVATLIGADARIRADRLAAMMGTIPYEIVSGILPRIPRVYINAYDCMNAD
ncbi:MAG: alanine racemase [Ruminococcaceae bacterium]|nr:alanine racemase [Oscillospiraceae bacterium]